MEKRIIEFVKIAIAGKCNRGARIKLNPSNYQRFLRPQQKIYIKTVKEISSIIYDFNDIMEIRKTAALDSSPTITNELLI
jgi:hypothetical protein